MSQHKESDELVVNGEPGENTALETPEDDREPGNDGGEARPNRPSPDGPVGVGDAETQADLTSDGENGNAIETDVSGAVKEAESEADLPSDAEQLRESQGMENVRNSTATVKVVLVPEGHVMTVAFVIGLSIQELKRHLASELRVPPQVLQISLDGTVVEEERSLMELGVRPHGSTRLEMSSTNPTTHPLRPVRPPELDNMPDVITVRVQTEEGVFQDVVVEIERPRQQKAFLGGYRHQLTGAVYHHAAVQTAPKRRPDRGVVVFSRDTQTVELKSQAQQCAVHVSTQMTGIGCYVSCMKDKLLTPGTYLSADEFHDIRLRAVIRLQSFARRWLAQQRVEQLRRERNRHLAWLDLQERRRTEEKEEQLRDRRHRWMNPQKRDDFNLLYHALEKWRCEEEQKINSSLRGAERKAALCSLLDQETQLIAAIGRHRIAVQHNNYDKTIRHFLDKSAAPYQWKTADGRLIEVDSPHTIRARELRDLYNDINMFTAKQDQRHQILMTLKHTVKEHDCQLSRDIVDLIDREVDLTTRGLKASSLEGLRKRISTLFLQYIKTPAFNPEVAKMLKVPQNPSQLKNDMFLCRSCQRYLRSTDFSPAANARRLRADEQQLNKEAKIPFLLQVEDVRYLVEVVWASRSAVHGSSDIYNLVFVRWERGIDWSPWNCILLSREETSAHLEVEDVHKTYEATFIRRIEHKHMLARRYFSQISSMAEFLDSQSNAALGNQLISKSMTMATGNQATIASPR
ncbi:IQ and ubiquitin-like domain-containing protein isoform X2 [Betta splendens]|uniref:IQ and ubiquitin-like domain-containing protein isoform X2 n=1 Tax=Betta splendens TaxID=158456 RepID=A0A6P7MUG5_BETSP|nr:IQ and ubiquitin-like domain-containing protein isoform X2 [Betta splendens]